MLLEGKRERGKIMLHHLLTAPTDPVLHPALQLLGLFFFS